MTTKDYVKFANLFAGELALADHAIRNSTDISSEYRRAIVNIVRSSADIFAQDNERFDREKFYQASGLKIIDSWTNPSPDPRGGDPETINLWG